MFAKKVIDDLKELGWDGFINRGRHSNSMEFFRSEYLVEASKNGKKLYGDNVSILYAGSSNKLTQCVIDFSGKIWNK